MCWKQDMFLSIVLEIVLVKLELDSFVQIRKRAFPHAVLILTNESENFGDNA